MHEIKTFFKRGVLSLAALAILGGCSMNEATGEQQFTAFLPEQAEESLGAREHKNITAQFGVVEDERLQKLVDDIGARITPHTEREDVTYRFTILDTDMVNAFAVPGGYIYVTRGLMALAGDEAELASVIAHEIAHVTARHSAQQFSRNLLASIGLTALSLAVDVPGLDSAASVGTDLYMKSYSREHEQQADSLGTRYLKRAGYDPFASARFLEQLNRYSILRSQMTGQEQMPFDFFSTHPLTPKRIEDSYQLASELKAEMTAEPRVAKDSYLNAIEGMIWGESPEQGYVRGSVFAHPVLDFRFEFPEGFEIQNLPDRVIGKSGNTMIVFTGGKKEPDQPIVDYMIQNWNQGRSGLSNVESITINGLPAVTASRTAVISGVGRNLRQVAIAYDDQQVYRFSILMPQNPSGALLDALKRTTYSFRKLNDTDRENFRPKEIDVITAQRGDTVASLSKRMAVEKLPEAKFRVLNAMDDGDTILAGQRYKIIR